jgi:hypothetical protein
MEHGLNTDFTNTGGIRVSSVAKSSCLYGGNPPGQASSVREPAIFPTFLLRTPKFSDFCFGARGSTPAIFQAGSYLSGNRPFSPRFC